MIEHRAVERLGRNGEAAGGAEVAFAGTGVTTRVIVGEHDSRTAVRRGVGDNGAEGKAGRPLITLVVRHVQAAGLIVDMRYPQILPRSARIGDATGEE